MRKERILILGAGLAGLSVAFFLAKKKVSVFEKDKEYGGLCRSFKKQGFIFDFGGHLLHFRSRETLSLVKNLLGGNLVKHRRNAFVFSFDKFIEYPFQVNLHRLPKKAAKDCLDGFLKAYHNRKISSKETNFLDWVNNKFGREIARYFLIPYNLKFWQRPLTMLSCQWADRFIVLPSPEEVSAGFQGKVPGNLGYHSSFWYPRAGGIEELVKAFSSDIDRLHLEQEAVEINTERKIVTFKNGGREKFDVLISTIPLPELGKIIRPVPKSVAVCFSKLKWVSIYNLNLGVEGVVSPGWHWIYFPQKEIPFFRTGFFHNFSPSAAPAGMSSLYVEVSYLQEKSHPGKNIDREIRRYLRSSGLVSKDNHELVFKANDINYAYPVYDKNYYPAKDYISRYLRSKNIMLCGRYGAWRYLSMEDVILDAKDVSKKVCSGAF